MGAFLGKYVDQHHGDDVDVLRDTMNTLARTLHDVSTGHGLDAGVVASARKLVGEVQAATDAIDRSKTSNKHYGPLAMKATQLQTEEAVRAVRVQWVVINAIWVVLSAATLSGAMDAIAETYHHAIDDLVDFVKKESLTQSSTTASIQDLLDVLEKRQRTVEDTMHDNMALVFPDIRLLPTI